MNESEAASYLYTLLHFDKWLPYVPYLNYPLPDAFAFAFRMLLTLLAVPIVWAALWVWLRLWR